MTFPQPENGKITENYRFIDPRIGKILKIIDLLIPESVKWPDLTRKWPDLTRKGRILPEKAVFYPKRQYFTGQCSTVQYSTVVEGPDPYHGVALHYARPRTTPTTPGTTHPAWAWSATLPYPQTR